MFIFNSPEKGDKIFENPLIDIAILGRFKAGKSSFINSFIGQSILPVGVIPVTTVITRLRYGMRERAAISFFDGTKTEVGFDEIAEQGLKYVSDELSTIDAIVSKTVRDTENIRSMMLDLQKGVKTLGS